MSKYFEIEVKKIYWFYYKKVKIYFNVLDVLPTERVQNPHNQKLLSDDLMQCNLIKHRRSKKKVLPYFLSKIISSKIGLF